MKHWYRDVILAVVVGALLAVATIQVDMIERKRNVIEQIVGQQQILLDRLAQLHRQVERFAK